MDAALPRNHWVHSATIPLPYARYYLEVARKRALDTSLILKQAGIDEGRFDDPTGLLSALEFFYLISAVTSQVCEPTLGFEIGTQHSITAHGSLGYALMCCSTLQQAIGLLLRFWILRGRGVQPFLHASTTAEQPEARTIVRFEPEPLMPPDIRQVILQSVLSSCYRGLRLLIGDEASRIELWFQENEPAHFAGFAAHLPHVRFGMTDNRIIVPGDLVTRPLETANPDHLKIAVAQCEREMGLMGQGESNLSERIQSAMIRGETGYPAVESLAEELHLSPRTLRRKLQQLGMSYQQLLENARHRDAVSLLEQGSMPVQEIAVRLGYQDPANFTRAFRQWTGVTPSQYRMEQSRLQGER